MRRKITVGNDLCVIPLSASVWQNQRAERHWTVPYGENLPLEGKVPRDEADEVKKLRLCFDENFPFYTSPPPTAEPPLKGKPFKKALRQRELAYKTIINLEETKKWT